MRCQPGRATRAKERRQAFSMRFVEGNRFFRECNFTHRTAVGWGLNSEGGKVRRFFTTDTPSSDSSATSERGQTQILQQEAGNRKKWPRESTKITERPTATKSDRITAGQNHNGGH